jgi:hypothetical protein
VNNRADEVNRDPAWLTAALLAGLPLVYGMLVLAPAKIAIDNSGGMSDLKERESNLRAWGVKKVRLAGGAWGLLWVLGSAGRGGFSPPPTPPRSTACWCKYSALPRSLLPAHLCTEPSLPQPALASVPFPNCSTSVLH